ncbi:MAG TPA: nicotinate phosphoribosyltransferase [Usitatibacter sp.]|jgi:nicotinate phosphoribosyltransferase|nr:nicotinate phosphoribosyltransferase [Usitatibacter sp.]
MDPVITSLLDTDVYKFTMLQTFLHRFPAATGEYRFACRSGERQPLTSFAEEIGRQVDHLCTLRFRPEELEYLSGLRYIKPDLVDYLDLFQFRRRFIRVEANDGKLSIVARGPLMHVMLFEIFVLAIVSEVNFSQFDRAACYAEGRQRLAAKIAQLRAFESRPPRRNPYVFFEFGTRRRATREWHDEVVRTLAAEVPGLFRGTSNVDMARRHGLVPIGTMAHEYLQAHQAFGYRLRDFQRAAFDNWVQEYRGDLGTALTDVVGLEAFLRDFDLYFAKLFDGLRQDSGDPAWWGERVLEHYARLRVDASTKMLTFSDALDFPKTFALYDRFADRAKVGFGIGTNLTNDMGVSALNIVMKIVRCNDQPVCKISDSPGKVMCDDEKFLGYLRQVFEQPG